MDVAALKLRIAERLDEDTTTSVFYTPASVLDSINKAQRFFCLLTHCLERTKTFELTANQTFYTITDDADFSDFLLPLRVTTGGVRVQPKTIHQLDGLSATWRSTPGTPTSYGMLGMYLLFTYPRYDVGSQSLSITYVAEPTALTADGNTPEIPTEFHQYLPDFAIWWLRLKEGGQESANALPLLRRFIEAAMTHADVVRARARAMSYDSQSFDLRSVDMSRMWKMALKSDRKPKYEGNGGNQ